MPDIIELTGQRILLEELALPCHIGVSAEERAKPQTLLVSLELELAPSLPQQDDLGEVVNYATLVEGLRNLARDQRVRLLETLVQLMRPVIFADPRVLRGRVTLRKPNIFPDAVAVGLSFDFTRL